MVSHLAKQAELGVRYLLSQPDVIGFYWSNYTDEPSQDAVGLVDSDNKPHEALTKVFASLDLAQLHTAGSPTPMDASAGIPQIPSTPTDLGTWNRTRGWIPPLVDAHRADLYASFAPEAFYLAVYWDEDLGSELLYADHKIPAADRPLIHIKVGKSYISIPVQSGLTQSTPTFQVIHSQIGPRNEVIVKIPVAAIGVQALKQGDKLSLDVGLATRARAYFSRWRGSYQVGIQP
jgi:hypothetical protein